MIKESFIHDVAGYIEQRISAVRLNQSYIIDDFVIKEVQDCCVAMEILVPYGSVNTINIIELLDGSEGVISSNEVVVPITSDTVILHAFEVGEG